MCLLDCVVEEVIRSDVLVEGFLHAGQALGRNTVGPLSLEIGGFDGFDGLEDLTSARFFGLVFFSICGLSFGGWLFGGFL